MYKTKKQTKNKQTSKKNRFWSYSLNKATHKEVSFGDDLDPELQLLTYISFLLLNYITNRIKDMILSPKGLLSESSNQTHCNELRWQEWHPWA